VVEFLLRPRFQAPLTFRQVCSQNGGCFGGYGLGTLPPVTGHIGDWVLGPGAGQLANQSGNTYLYQNLLQLHDPYPPLCAAAGPVALVM
jgi:hypothetical protein